MELEKIFQKYGVSVAYLFGSQANGKTHAGSDTDIAVRFSKDLTMKKLLELINELSVFHKNSVEIVDLDKAPLPLKFRVFQARKLLYAKDLKKEVMLRARELSFYYDNKYYYDRFTEFETKRILTHGLV